MEIVVKQINELWEELNDALQRGIPDVHSLNAVYNRLTKFMSVCMVNIRIISESIDIDNDPDEYEKDVRGMVLKNMHYNERHMLRHLKRPKIMKDRVIQRDGYLNQFEQCKDIQRVLRDRLEVFKLEYQLSGGNYQ